MKKFYRKEEAFGDMKPEETFYDQSSDWLYDMYHSQSVWLKRSLLALFIESLCLILALTIILSLLPLKHDVPFLYAFNNATGEVTKLGKLEQTVLAENDQMTRFFIMHYVIDRESYDFYNIDRPYQLTWAMTDSSIIRSYESGVSSDNPSSPYHTYGKDKYITVNVLSINQLNNNTADVRFEKTLHDRNSETQQTVQCEAIIKWKYSKIEATQKMLDRDPLGFKVIYYQVSQVNLQTH